MGQGKKLSSKWVRVPLTLGLLFSFGLLATGCGSTTTTAKTVNLRIWRLNQNEDILKSTIAEFNKLYSSQAKFNIVYTKRSSGEYELDSLKSLAAKTGPDVWSIPDDWLGDHTNRIVYLPDNFFYPRDKNNKVASEGTSPVDQVKKIFPAGIANHITGRVLDGKNYKEVVWGMPLNVDSLRLYTNDALLDNAYNEFKESLGKNPKAEVYNPVKSLLSKAPTTWQELVEQERYITKQSNGSFERSTIALGTADNIPNSADILQLMMLQNGTKIVSDDHTTPQFHIPSTTPVGVSVKPGELALDFFSSFSNPNKETYTWNPSMPEALDAFGQGKVAMVIAFSDFKEQLAVKYPKLKYTAGAVPQNSTVDDPINLIRFDLETVTKAADNISAAQAMLRLYTDSSTAASIASERKLLSPYLETLNKKKDDVYNKAVLTGVAVYKKSRTLFDEAFRQMILDTSQNGLTSEQSIAKGADAIDNILSDDGRL